MIESGVSPAQPWSGTIPACACGSGLRPERCCGLDWAEPAAAAEPVAEFARALSAARTGQTAEAERLSIIVLERFPRHVGALDLLYQIRRAQDRMPAAEALLARIVRLDPNNLKATQTLASLLFGRGALAEAEHHARNAVRLAPNDPQSHNLMGMIMTEANRPQIGEYHYRRVLALSNKRDGILLANLAWNLKNQGRMEESRKLYEESVQLSPNVYQTLYGWARMEETDRNFARAGELLEAADKTLPNHPNTTLARAVLHGRTKEYEKAITILDNIERQRGDSGLGPMEST